MCSVNPEEAAIERTIDTLIKKAYKRDAPGATVIVTRRGKVLFRRAYGMANLELGVPLQPEMVLRLGSITKQFTAVAILMLAEQNKLALADEITRFLPDYPTQGHKITIEHLLTHTSGIKSYTSMPEWFALWRKDMALTELIDLFKNQPMDFAPGERMLYNNSGYILLGAIIEQVNGQPYGQFLREHIFRPLGMKHTRYDDLSAIIPQRASGYSGGADGFINAAYLSMTQPHAAGALISSVDDLAIWDKSLYTEKLLTQASLQRAWQPYRLNSGASTGYGYGWSRFAYEGREIIAHGGGINGFSTYALRIPDERVFVAVFSNLETSDPTNLAIKIAALVIGKPYREPKAIALDPAALDTYIGVYETNEKEERLVQRQEGKLLWLAGGVTDELHPITADEFFLARNSFQRLRFVRDESGRIIALESGRLGGTPQHAVKTERPLPAACQVIALAPEVLARYVGKYEVGPGFAIAISLEGMQLVGQMTGQPRVVLLPESETLFAVQGVNAQVEFQIENGAVVGLVLLQGKQRIPARKTSG